METGDQNKKKDPNPNRRIIGGKESLAEFCWEVLTAGKDPEIWNEITDGLLAKAGEQARAAGYEKPCREALRYIAEHCWKEGFIASMAAQEFGVFQRMEVNIPKPEKEGTN